MAKQVTNHKTNNPLNSSLGSSLFSGNLARTFRNTTAIFTLLSSVGYAQKDADQFQDQAQKTTVNQNLKEPKPVLSDFKEIDTYHEQHYQQLVNLYGVKDGSIILDFAATRANSKKLTNPKNYQEIFEEARIQAEEVVSHLRDDGEFISRTVKGFTFSRNDLLHLFSLAKKNGFPKDGEPLGKTILSLATQLNNVQSRRVKPDSPSEEISSLIARLVAQQEKVTSPEGEKINPDPMVRLRAEIENLNKIVSDQVKSWETNKTLADGYSGEITTYKKQCTAVFQTKIKVQYQAIAAGIGGAWFLTKDEKIGIRRDYQNSIRGNFETAESVWEDVNLIAKEAAKLNPSGDPDTQRNLKRYRDTLKEKNDEFDNLHGKLTAGTNEMLKEVSKFGKPGNFGYGSRPLPTQKHLDFYESYYSKLPDLWDTDPKKLKDGPGVLWFTLKKDNHFVLREGKTVRLLGKELDEATFTVWAASIWFDKLKVDDTFQKIGAFEIKSGHQSIKHYGGPPYGSKIITRLKEAITALNNSPAGGLQLPNFP